jgi:hypothetical protein
MRYNEFKLLEFADDNIAQTTSKLAPSAATQQVQPQLQRFQTMMNNDQILELYDMLNIDYEDDIIDKLTTNQGQENANFRTTQRKRTQRAPSKTARK